MATIKAGTYTMKNDISLPASYLDTSSLLGYLTVGGLNTGYSFSVNSTEIKVVLFIDDEEISYLVFQNGAWSKDQYRTWVFSEDVNADDEFSTWFNDNLDVQTKLNYVRLYREDNLPYNILEAQDDAGMTALAADSGSANKIVKFTGTGSSTYDEGRFYICEKGLSEFAFSSSASGGHGCSEYLTPKTYYFEEGMTWAEWCDSDYNTDGWVVTNANWVSVHNDPMYVVCEAKSPFTEWQRGSDVISTMDYICYEQ